MFDRLACHWWVDLSQLNTLSKINEKIDKTFEVSSFRLTYVDEDGTTALLRLDGDLFYLKLVAMLRDVLVIHVHPTIGGDAGGSVPSKGDDSGGPNQGDDNGEPRDGGYHLKVLCNGLTWHWWYPGLKQLDSLSEIRENVTTVFEVPGCTLTYHGDAAVLRFDGDLFHFKRVAQGRDCMIIMAHATLSGEASASVGQAAATVGESGMPTDKTDAHAPVPAGGRHWSEVDEQKLVAFCKGKKMARSDWECLGAMLGGRTGAACETKWKRMKKKLVGEIEAGADKEHRSTGECRGDASGDSDNDSEGSAADALEKKGMPWSEEDEKTLASLCRTKPFAGWKHAALRLGRADRACYRKWLEVRTMWVKKKVWGRRGS
jgi:hypothetical protein